MPHIFLLIIGWSMKLVLKAAWCLGRFRRRKYPSNKCRKQKWRKKWRAFWRLLQGQVVTFSAASHLHAATLIRPEFATICTTTKNYEQNYLRRLVSRVSCFLLPRWLGQNLPRFVRRVTRQKYGFYVGGSQEARTRLIWTSEGTGARWPRQNLPRGFITNR